LRSICKLSLYGLIAVLTAQPALSVKTSPGKNAPQAEHVAECRGKDMLDELASSDPEAFSRIRRQADSATNSGAVLWKIKKAGLAPSYLFGTLHLTDRRVTTLSPKVLAALDTAKNVLIESSNSSSSAVANALTKATETALFTDGRSLEKLLPPDEFEEVRKTVSRAGLPAGTARLYKPWLITMLISSSDCERESIKSGRQILDMKIAEEAKKRGILVSGMETLAQQLAAMASVPINQQVQMLRASLKFADRTNDLVETMVQLYLKRRMSALWPFQIALAAQAGVSEDSYASYKKALIVERNQKMHDVSLPFIEKGSTFIAVGALHLPDRTGLVSLLSASGYTLTPIE
jgi:uncharacterized protein